jgi:hypothetical protein
VLFRRLSETSKNRPATLMIIAIAMFAGAPVHAAPVNLINNGGFEIGLAGWAQFILGSAGWFQQSGTHNPLTGTFTVPAPPQGNLAAMTDAATPGEHILSQPIVVPSGVTSATLQFSRFINNATLHSGPFVSPNSLTYAGFPNQQARVDFITPTSIIDSVAPADVLLNIFQTQPGDALVSGYTVQTTDVTALLAAHPNQSLTLRFAETDNQGILYFGIDQVSLVVVTVPEPGSIVLGLIAAAGLCVVVIRRRRVR